MSESLHELEAALADAQREAALAEDEYTERSARWNAKPTMKRHLKLWDAFHAREDALHRFARAQEAVERARRKEAEHPPLKEGLGLEVTAGVLDELQDSGQLHPVDPAVAADELDNPAAPIVEVDAPGRHRADDTSTPVVTLAPVNGEGRFVPLGTVTDGPAKGATVYTEGAKYGDEAEQGYVRNEQGAYEYDGPVGEQPDVPPWDGSTPAPGNPEWESTVRNLYGISADTPIVAHKEMWTTGDGRTQSRTSYGPPKEPNVITVDHNRTDRFYGLPVYVQDGIAKDTVYVLREDGDGGAVLMGPDTFATLQSKMDEVRHPNPDVASAFDLKAKLDRIRNISRGVNAGFWDDPTPIVHHTDEAPVTKAEADEAPKQKSVDELMVEAGKAAQERWESQYGQFSRFGRMGYTEAFAKAGDVPSAPADHVAGVTDPESVTVNTERDTADFGSDTVKLKSQTITSEFTMTEAQPEYFQKVFPNARVVIGSDGKVNITANSVESTAKAATATEPTTPEGKLLAEAAQIIGHDRNDQYGNAEDSFGVIAEFWSTWLTARRFELTEIDIDSVESITVTAADVANMLGLMKKARTAVGGHKRDNYVDEAGYVALAERCEAKGSGL